jgi:hypothetical protein
MAKDTPTLELIQRTYHHNSTQGKNLAKLVRQYDARNNTMGIALVNQLLTIIRDKLPEGERFSGVIAPKYVAHMFAPKGEKLGKATISGQALREGHGYKIVLYDRFEDLQSNSAQLAGIGATKGVYDFLVGNEHKETLERILAANFEPRQLRDWKKERDEETEKVASLREDFDQVFSEMGVDMSTYRRMLLLGPVQVGGDESVLRALADPHAFRSDLSWLAGNINVMPAQVQAAFFNYTSPVTKASRTDIPLLLAAIYQAKPEKALGIIGQFRDDALLLEKLPDDHPVFDTVDKPDLDARFEPIVLVKGTNAPDDNVSLREKMDQQFVTKSDALSLMRTIPVYEAREVHNKLAAQKYLGNNFPQLMASAKAIMDEEAGRYRQSKIDKDDFEPRTIKREYHDVREAADFIAYAQGHLQESEREALCRLLPMTKAPRIFSNIYLVATKAKLGKSQLEHFVPAADFGEDAKEKIDRIRHTPIAVSSKNGVGEEYKMAAKAGVFKGKKGIKLGLYHTLASTIDNDEIVPSKLAKKDDNGKTLLDVLHEVVATAEPVDDETKRTIDHLKALTASPLAVNYSGLGMSGTQRWTFNPSFNLRRYENAGYLLKEQRDSIANVFAAVKALGFTDIDLERLASDQARVNDNKIMLASPCTDYLVPAQFKDEVTSQHGIYFKKNLIDAVEAMNTKQDPKLFGGLRRTQACYQDELKMLEEGKAYASAALLEQAKALHASFEKGERKIDCQLALDDKNKDLYGRCSLYDAHAVSKGADPKGEVIATFSKKSGDGLAGLAYQHDRKLWEGRFTQEQLTDMLQRLAYSNFMKQRDVMIQIDCGKQDPVAAPTPQNALPVSYYLSPRPFRRSYGRPYRRWR